MTARAVNAELQSLAGRLIEAQDADRGRVARELRDDASQQIAGLSIMWISRSTTTAAGSTRRSHRWMVSG